MVRKKFKLRDNSKYKKWIMYILTKWTGKNYMSYVVKWLEKFSTEVVVQRRRADEILSKAFTVTTNQHSGQDEIKVIKMATEV